MKSPDKSHATCFPAGACDAGAAQGDALLLAGIRAEGATPATFPETGVSSGVRAGVEDRRKRLNFVQRTVAGAAQFERLAALSCFPFNCADKTGGTSTKRDGL